MTRITAIALAACLLAGCSVMAGRYREVGEPGSRHVGAEGVEACTAPGREGECTTIKNVRLSTRGFETRGGVSFSKSVLPDGGEVWVKTWDLITLPTDETLARRAAKQEEAATCKRKGGASIG